MTQRSQPPSESQARHAGNGKDEWISRFARNASGGLERDAARAGERQIFGRTNPRGTAGTILAIRTRAVQIAERPSWPNEPKGPDRQVGRVREDILAKRTQETHVRRRGGANRRASFLAERTRAVRVRRTPLWPNEPERLQTRRESSGQERILAKRTQGTQV
jgi:hypothetical protein